MTKTPKKYRAKERKYENKSWLQQKYWGDFLSTKEIAEEIGCNHTLVNNALIEFGIPRRTRSYDRDNSISPFTGFYRNAAARTDKRSLHQYDENYEHERELEWQKAAKNMDIVSDKAVLD